MAKTVANTAPGTTFVMNNGDAFDADTIETAENKLAAFADDHDASHWNIKLSAPKLGAGGISAAGASTGGSMTSSQTKYSRFTYETPNGETARSSEQSVVLGGSDNAIQYTVDQASAQFTPYLWVYQALAGAASGQPTYRCRQADLSIVSGAGASVDANGRITLSTSAPTVFKVIAHPPNTEPVAPTTNNSGSGDPLILNQLPYGNSMAITDNNPDSNHYRVVETITFTNGLVVTVTAYYDKTTSPVRISTTQGMTIAVSGIIVARFLPTYGTHPVTGAPFLSAFAQQEA